MQARTLGLGAHAFPNTSLDYVGRVPPDRGALPSVA